MGRSAVGAPAVRTNSPAADLATCCADPPAVLTDSRRRSGAHPMRRPSRRRSLRGVSLAIVAALVLVASTSCGPPRGGVALAKRIAWMQLNARGWTSQAPCLVELWQHESGWNVYAYNKSSGAYGIPQALPAKRMA